MSKKRLDPDFPDKTAKILMGFCIKEKLNYPLVKGDFLKQAVTVQREHLKYMEQVIKAENFNYETYKHYLASLDKN